MKTYKVCAYSYNGKCWRKDCKDYGKPCPFWDEAAQSHAPGQCEGECVIEDGAPDEG